MSRVGGEEEKKSVEAEYSEEQASSRNYPPRPSAPLYLPQFTTCFDEGKQSHYLYHPGTGECIFIENEWGDASGCDRKYSCWTRPSQPFSSREEMRADVTSCRKVEEMHHFLSNEDEGEAPRSPKAFKSDEEALVLMQSFFRQVRDKARYRNRIRAVFAKYYDEESFLFFFLNTVTSETQWHRPIGLGNSAENGELAAAPVLGIVRPFNMLNARSADVARPIFFPPLPLPLPLLARSSRDEFQCHCSGTGTERSKRRGLAPATSVTLRKI